jgi:hypothetical protein
MPPVYCRSAAVARIRVLRERPIHSAAERFDYETEMLILASRAGCRIASVPISTVYSDEVSSIHPVRDTLRFFKLMRRYRRL